ncbi:hypothetical protein GCM10027168_54650 [Streptomyces capparidis]
MTTGLAPVSSGSSPHAMRSLEPEEWSGIGIPLLRDPRGVVNDLHVRHLPSASTAVVAVLDHEQRLVASASFAQRQGMNDGWEHRNALLWHLRRVVPHDLRRRTPVRTGVLMLCREGAPGWTEADGAWMWGLRDACTLHGLRCGPYIALTPHGWQVIGDGRGGRNPHAGSWAEQAADGAALRPVARPLGALRRNAAR